MLRVVPAHKPQHPFSRLFYPRKSFLSDIPDGTCMSETPKLTESVVVAHSGPTMRAFYTPRLQQSAPKCDPFCGLPLSA